jgi:hypothetical protein
VPQALGDRVQPGLAIQAPCGKHPVGAPSAWSSHHRAVGKTLQSLELRAGRPDLRPAGAVLQKVGDPGQIPGAVWGSLERRMALHFSRVAPATEELEIWSAIELGYSFVISNESRSGPGLHGQPGFVASWRPININRTAIKVGGSPFKTFAEAEKACEAMLLHLIK